MTTSSGTFDTFYAEVMPLVFRTLLLATGDRELAADATQEAFTQAYRRWEDLITPKAWVMRVAINYRNRWWRRIGSREVLAADTEVLDVTVEGLAAAAPVAAHFDPELVKALADLSSRQRTVVALRYLYDLQTNEIAEVLGIDSATVSVHHSRAMDALRRRLTDRGEGGAC